MSAILGSSVVGVSAGASAGASDESAKKADFGMPIASACFIRSLDTILVIPTM